ncbi:MAG: RsmD family RNA methyltransferase [Bacteroidota bacterium]
MRIISGKFKGYQFKTYNGSNTRPTTDLAKEGLFSAIENTLDFEGKTIIDLFAGTGNIGLECLSRGAASLISIDANAANITYMKAVKAELNIDNWTIFKSDALKYIQKTEATADIIFADPPYNYNQIHGLSDAVTSHPDFTQRKGIFILEHTDNIILHSPLLKQKKQYGSTTFSIFEAQ